MSSYYFVESKMRRGEKGESEKERGERGGKEREKREGGDMLVSQGCVLRLLL